MKLATIHHVAIIASSIEKTKEFYVEKLGFEIIRESIREDKNDIKLDLKINNDTQLEIFVKQDAPKRLTHPEALGLRHLSFKVEDIEKVVYELELKGIKCETIRKDSYTNEKLVFFKDPDGLPIEIHE